MSKLFAISLVGVFMFVFFGFAYAQMMGGGEMPMDLAENGYYPPDYPAAPTTMMNENKFTGGYRHGVMFGGMGVSLMWLLHFSIIIWFGVGILLFLFLWGKVFKK